MMRRVEWIDVARGLAIILIVMLHARDYALSLIPPSPEHVVRWTSIDPLFGHIRLPAFFLISGMLASGHISARHGEARYNVRRTLRLLAVYLFWSIPLLLIAPDWPRDTWHLPDGDLYADLLRGRSVLWYIWALVMAFGFACAVRRLPPLAAVIVAAGLGTALHVHGEALGGAFGQLGQYLPYYILGIRYPFALLWLARWRSPVGFAILACAYVLGMAVEAGHVQLDALREVMGICLAVTGIGWATERWPGMARWLGWMGRRTLPIYIFHFPLLAFIGSAAVRHAQPVAGWTLTLILFLPMLSATVIAVSLGLSALLHGLGLGWTLAMPGQRREAAERAVPAMA